MSARSAGAHVPGQAHASLHATLRFATGVTAAFIACEALQWTPTFLAPLLTAALLTKLPGRPPMKVVLVLVIAMSLAALFSFVMASLLRGTPTLLSGAIALCMFLSFYAMRSGPGLPFMLLLICLTTIPVMVMVAPAQAGMLPVALIRSIVMAVLVVLLVYLPWPHVAAPTAPPAATPGAVSPLASAALSTAVVVPLMLVYLLWGIADALPVLVASVMMVVNFDLQQGRLQAATMIFGNFAGGLLGLLLHTVLLTTPSLAFLALLLFPVLLWFGPRVAAGAPSAGVVLTVCNSMLIILGLAIASGPGSISLWVTRLFQFSLAGAFAVGMMTLVWYRRFPRHSPTPGSAIR